MMIYPSLVLGQPRKTHLYISERLLMGRKESNQTKQTHDSCRCMIAYHISDQYHFLVSDHIFFINLIFFYQTV